MNTTPAPFVDSQRVIRRMDGKPGTVVSVTPWDSDTGSWAVAVRLDHDGEVWSGTEVAWDAMTGDYVSSTNSGPYGRTERRTEYGLAYRGQLMAGLVLSREGVDSYVAAAVRAGQNPADYVVVHRAVTVEPWFLTTPTPATMDARRAATVGHAPGAHTAANGPVASCAWCE